MIKNSAYYGFYASYTVPNPDVVGYWIDLGANARGKVIKVYNHSTRQWVKLTDATSEDAVSPYIGSNGNWYVDNRDTGIPASGKNPYIGDDWYWYVFDAAANEYVNSGVVAKGYSAYDSAVLYGYEGTEEEWVASLSAASEEAAAVALAAAEAANEAAASVEDAVANLEAVTTAAVEATEAAVTATEDAEEATATTITVYSNPPKIVDDYWWIYNVETGEYETTGVRATGKSFKIVKVYSSVAEMEADTSGYVTEGEFVWINTGDVEDEEDSQLYLLTADGWELVGDLSGSQGIQGLSAYEVAVANGYEGTEEEWLESLLGEAATIEVGTVTTLTSSEDATVVNSGTALNAVLDFGIPQGKAATVSVGTVTTGEASTEASVTNSGTDEDAIFDFVIPQGVQGEAATITIGTVTTGDAGTEATVVNSGTENDAILDFTIPKGDQGDAATISLGLVSTGDASTSVIITNSGDEHDAIFDFTIPKGDDGEAATITVGTTTTTEAGTEATVTNSGTSLDAILDFTIPKGDQGDPGTGLTILGYYETEDELTESVTDPEAGDAYGVNIADATDGEYDWGVKEYSDEDEDVEWGVIESNDLDKYDIYIYDGVNETWVNIGTLQGDVGDTGAQGEEGRGVDEITYYYMAMSDYAIVSWSFDDLTEDGDGNYFADTKDKYNFANTVGEITCTDGEAIFDGTQVIKTLFTMWNGDLSVSFRITPTVSTTGIVLQSSTASESGFAIYTYASDLLFDFGGNRWRISAGLTVSNKSHFVLTYNWDSGEVICYKDGVLLDTTTVTSIEQTFADYLWSGASSTSSEGPTAATQNTLQAKLDDVRIYNAVLTADEVAEIYENSEIETSGDWSTTCPTLTETLQYLWCYQMISYSDDTTSETTPSMVGIRGDNVTINGSTTLTIAAGDNITITQDEDTLTITGDVQETDLSAYATISYVDEEIASLDSRTEALENSSTNVSYYAEYSEGVNLSTITIDGVSTTEYVPIATTDTAGVVSISDGLNVEDGVLSVLKSESSEDYLTVDSTGVSVTGIDDINTRLTTAESDIDTLESSVSTNTSNITTLSNTVTSLATEINTSISELTTDVNELVENTYTKEEVDAKVSSVYKYCGTVDTYDDLPTDSSVGDVYNVEDTGANYAWDGESWDKLSETIDLTPYATTEAMEEALATKVDVEDGKGLSTNDYTDEEKEKLAGIEENANNYDLGTITIITDLTSTTAATITTDAGALTAGVTGVLPIAYGGTGSSTGYVLASSTSDGLMSSEDYTKLASLSTDSTTISVLSYSEYSALSGTDSDNVLYFVYED